MAGSIAASASSSSTSAAAYLQDLFAMETNTLHPYGTDPVFLPSSSLHDARLANQVNHYYNISAGSLEVSATGAPYSYFHRPLQVRVQLLCA